MAYQVTEVRKGRRTSSNIVPALTSITVIQFQISTMFRPYDGKQALPRVPSARNAVIVKKSYLLKREEYLLRWKLRFFILFSDGRLSGFKTEPKAEEERERHHNDFTVEDCQIMIASKPKPFTFVIRGLQLTSVVERTFSVETEDEREAWVQAIESVKEVREVGMELSSFSCPKMSGPSQAPASRGEREEPSGRL